MLTLWKSAYAKQVQEKETEFSVNEWEGNLVKIGCCLIFAQLSINSCRNGKNYASACIVLHAHRNLIYFFLVKKTTDPRKTWHGHNNNREMSNLGRHVCCVTFCDRVSIFTYTPLHLPKLHAVCVCFVAIFIHAYRERHEPSVQLTVGVKSYFWHKCLKCNWLSFDDFFKKTYYKMLLGKRKKSCFGRTRRRKKKKNKNNTSLSIISSPYNMYCKEESPKA